ncbi:tRNA (N6-threonylcarbamoyladenosine(37)-N6)-methyltransferase TrmO [Celerinatantimonas sp. MCCC 1A17872]|uniref:tRNA (N6-threonylcarbamoyladenosine(37)-N6)-methyltransferase TrmO n=1 Tax=Celerinatantimonas sp. MCCC 1A17872 TaxID=3177514 RepID=UPI0038C45C3D
MTNIELSPIGVARTPFKTREQMPIQGAGISQESGQIEIFSQYQQGLADLDGFSHIYVLFHLHQSAGTALTVTPFLDKTPRGVFATRSPKRPNPIGLTIVRLNAIEGNILQISELDLLDGTPIIDLKPYSHQFDCFTDTTDGWMSHGRDPKQTSSDDRFNR